MMLVSVTCVLISLCASASITEENQAQIISYENESDGKGNYKFSFVTSNGIERSETGRLWNVGEPDEYMDVQGVYSYKNPEGKLILVHYTANKDGYHIKLAQPQVEVDYDGEDDAISNQVPHLVASLIG